jgi:hypothetical protein
MKMTWTPRLHILVAVKLNLNLQTGQLKEGLDARFWRFLCQNLQNLAEKTLSDSSLAFEVQCADGTSSCEVGTSHFLGTGLAHLVETGLKTSSAPIPYFL